MMGVKQSGSDTLEDLARICERRLTGHGLGVLARVRESERAFDLALASASGLQHVVRCVAAVELSDHRALKTMLTEGDFTRAFIIYTSEDQPHLSGEIETYPLSRIDELAALLAKESAP
jgi:hypothetical protein